MPEPAIPDANGVECHDCGSLAGDYHEGNPRDGCPESSDHPTSPVYISEEPLGRSDDDDNYVGSIGKYVYDKG